MKNKLKVLLSVVLVLILVLALGACSSGSSGSSSESSSSSSSDSSSGEDKANGGAAFDDIFAMYNKVSLEQPKSEVDAALGSEGVLDENAGMGYTYMDKADKYGVFITFDDGNKVTSKSVIYQDHKELAGFSKAKPTEALCDKIQPEATYESVVEAFGGEGVEVNIGKAYDGSIVKMYRWCNEDNSCAQIVFSSEGKVIGSADFYEDY